MPPTLPPERRRVLVVDDDPAFCAIMREVLQRHDFEVHVAFSVAEALGLMERVRPHLLLVDIMMPEVDGLTLLRRVRAEPAWSAIPAVVVSARVFPPDIQQAERAGADAFVPKPFSVDFLRQTIERVLASRRN